MLAIALATYAIGDLQGCDVTLGRLLERIAFDASRDRLWFVGDLVNRGPRSVAVLRRLRALGPAVTAVLGNHDLHLLSRAEGVARPKQRDRLEDVLLAPDRDELLCWLRKRPLLHREGGHVLVHAGLLPQWSVERAAELAGEIEELLRGRDRARLFQGLLERPEEEWSKSLTGPKRWATIVAALTRLRTCTPAGRMDLGFSGPPDDAAKGYLPWFRVPDRKSKDATIVFGHWAALGLKLKDRYLALDSGCVYGNLLTALRLEDRTLFQERYAD